MALQPRPLFTRFVAYLLFAAATAIFFSPGSHAAEIRCAWTWGDALSNGDDLPWDDLPSRAPSPASCLEILIKGEIVTDDSAKFAQLLRSNHPFVHSVILWSSGGSVEAAMEIGRMIRKDLLETTAPIDVQHVPNGAGYLLNPKFALYVPSELPDPSMQNLCAGEACHCASACFLIWAAGVSRSGTALGLHRPSIRSTSFGDLPPQRASGLYRLILREIDAYLAEMEIPRRYIEIMTDTSSMRIWSTQSRWICGMMTFMPSISLSVGMRSVLVNVRAIRITCRNGRQPASHLGRRTRKRTADGRPIPLVGAAGPRRRPSPHRPH